MEHHRFAPSEAAARSDSALVCRLRSLGLAGAFLLSIGALSGCQSAPPEALDRPEPVAVSSVIEDSVHDFVERTKLQGVVRVTQGTQPLVAGSFGFASIEDAEATTQATRFQLGSISKWVASLVVLEAVDRGELSLTEPIASYLPDYRADTGAQLTLHDLISHRSGLPNDIIAAIRADPSVLEAPLALDEAVAQYASGDLLFPPGERFDYSHSNWILVQAILEAVSGRSYRQLVDERMVRPLGLEGTGIAVGDFSAVSQIAHSYSQVEPVPARASAEFPDFLAAAGGAYSTAPDLVSLLEAVSVGDYLSNDSAAKLLEITTEDEGYTYGGRVRSMELAGKDELLVWHTGSNGPSKARVTRVLSSGVSVIVLNAVDVGHDETAALTEEILNTLAGGLG